MECDDNLGTVNAKVGSVVDPANFLAFGEALYKGEDAAEVAEVTYGVGESRAGAVCDHDYKNILFDKEEADMDEVIEAAKASNAHNFISQLPQGYDTKLCGEERRENRDQLGIINGTWPANLLSHLLCLEKEAAATDKEKR
ncbi:ABC transporter B family member 15 [Camellia lanceoleosa]|uniref:ABC transporter B family member 15 n=1 Tax=Camellia lanceoleosa TaxID=1840588 RepID=A0ACC0H1H8_9ERIC|nr:ABC transporter B family member 15 [Camellia lanceoleosa]